MDETDLTAVSKVEQQSGTSGDLGKKGPGSMGPRQLGTSSRPQSMESGSRATSRERHEMERAELEELRAERDRMIKEAARSLREAKECAEFTRLQAQQEYDTWRQSCEQGPREWAEERREMNLAMERQRDKLRKMRGEKLDLDISYAEVERARAAAENAKESAERDLARIRSDTQRVESETAFQRGYPPKGLSYRSEVQHCTPHSPKPRCTEGRTLRFRV